MKYIALILTLVFGSCLAGEADITKKTKSKLAKSGAIFKKAKEETAAPAWRDSLPVYDHIVIVIEENKDWNDIIHNSSNKNTDAPYINKLIKAGTLFTNSFGMEHHSQGNYYWLFSGSNQNVGFADVVPVENCPISYPFATSNLAYQLNKKKGLTFKGYSQSLPRTGSMKNKTHYGNYKRRIAYARKHVPWTSFSNIDHSDSLKSVHQTFSSFPKKDFNNLPTVSFVIPDLQNDMHNYHSLSGSTCKNKGSVCIGDLWLKNNLGAYYDWVQDEANNSLLIVTFDENNGFGMQGLTNPLAQLGDSTGTSILNCKMDMDTVKNDHKDACTDQNNIVTVFTGARIRKGYTEEMPINHVTILRTIEAMYKLNKSGQQSDPALKAGISDDKIITSIFTPVK
jgi:acid phosphatase